MDYKQIFSLSDKDSKGAFVVYSTTREMDDYKLLRGEELNIERRYTFIHNPYCGKKLYDVISSGYPGLLLFSERVITLLKEHQVTGWETIYPSILLDDKDLEVKGYSIFSVLGRCGAIDFSKSERVLRPAINPGGNPIYKQKGLYFDLDTWDKSDIFTAKDTMYTFVTKRVKDILEKNKVTNICLISCADLERF